MSHRRVRIAVMLGLATMLWLAAAAPAVPSPGAPSAKVARSVLRQTAHGGTATFLVVLARQADLSGAQALPTKLAKGRFVFGTLRSFAARTQAPIETLLDRMGARYRSHWVVNLLRVSGTRAVVDALAARADVARIIPDPWIKSTILPPRSAAAPHAPDTVEWNIDRIHAPQAWAHGYTGQGIVLGDIDTGEQWDHPALKPHYRGWSGSSANHNYNWYDATDPTNRAPVDPYGHGTLTAGVMVGDDGAGNQIGVAPGAKWIGCRSMNSSGFGSPDTYITCLEFMVAPWNLDGQNPDPTKAPEAINNSWYCSISQEGCTQGVLYTAVKNVRAAGIVPVVAAGNSGPTCSTIGIDGPPAQYDESYTVGATTSSNALASYSSRGPATVPHQTLIKPDIVAPGDGIRSSWPPDTYASASGTSLAAPHIAGTIALIYSAKPSLIGDVDATETLINSTAHHIDSSECSSSGSYPNNLYGYGFVDAARAVRP